MAMLITLLIYLVPAAVNNLLSTVNITKVDQVLNTGIVTADKHTIRTTNSISILLLSGANAVALNGHRTSRFVPTRNISRGALTSTTRLTSLTSRAPRNHDVIVLTGRHFGLHRHSIRSLRTAFMPFATRDQVDKVGVSGHVVHGNSISTVHHRIRTGNNRFPASISRGISRITHRKTAPLIIIRNSHILNIVTLGSVIGNNVGRHFTRLHGVNVGAIVVANSGHLATTTVTTRTNISSFLTRTAPRTGLTLVHRCRTRNHLITVANSNAGSTPTLTRTSITITVGSNARTTGRTNGVISLSSGPAGLVRIMRVNGRVLVAHNSLAAFDVTGSITGCFTVVPTTFTTACPRLGTLGVVHLRSPSSTVLDTIVFGTLVVIFLVPLTLGNIDCGPLATSTVLHHGL